MYKLSIISPVYDASSLLPSLIEEIDKIASELTDNYEIILVEDNSPDNSWQIIHQIAKNNAHITGIRFSRNFGQQEALHAGMKYSTGDYIVTLDCDLQDPPSEIINLIKKAEEGFDIVMASRVNRKDDIIKRTASKTFHCMLSYLSDIKMDSSVANFVLYRRNALDALISMGDYFVNYPFMAYWVGFRKCVLPFNHRQRRDNKNSSYSYKKRFKLAFYSIIAFSDKPLKIVLRFGILIVLVSIAFAILLVLLYLTKHQSVPGWMSIFLSIWFLGGMIISILGMVGIYVGNIFEKVKERPNYIVREIYNCKIND